MSSITDTYNHLQEHHPDIDSDWWPTRSGKRFEIAAGCILTQNTKWENAEKAIANLYEHDLLSPEAILDADLEHHVYPSGFYRQKAARLQRLARYLLHTETPEREELLDIKGVGKETADSILLYAFDQLYFIIDTYTRRIVDHYDVTHPDKDYDELRQEFEHALPDEVSVYKQFHALIVRHGKQL